MNEFRKFLGLKRSWHLTSFLRAPLLTGIEEFETFEEWNPDPEIAVCEPCFLDDANTQSCFFVQGAARRLYGHVDNLELYVCPVQIQCKRQPCD